MSMVINTNTAASQSAANLQKSNSMLQKSLARLSSGSKITSPADDAGGLAVSMKLESALSRTDATSSNVQNAISFLQSQDGALDTAANIVDRMSELKTLYSDVTKTADDKKNYYTEFNELQSQLTSLKSEKLNGVSLFAAGSSTTSLTVQTSEDGSQTVGINQSLLSNAVSGINASDESAFGALDTSDFTDAMQELATLRAENGAQTSRLQFASDMLSTNRVNLEAANSRIVDVDVASESTEFAKNNILVQSGTAMLAQANSISQNALRLLG